ncbi:toxin FitB [Bathymodiolus platifrons methanotrophic gill symbiont]|uniref:type II toxin-antitoxin system VapC family toxin n=1 Tax=Bathymodiolus platifrons methanotrophic gill symbiont TaxID=113268 RepID=UPI0011C933D2|nr:type II toxin-antitoxin system VapC family toxin [Bathymodiolus platifrons methanotrophic gill symbiont]TXL01787.1 VapC toxin family PIN domain ribonuclease [Methylococcaceae bacterium HT1]TXL16338.1 VapC toxin family PIN domain ribonuclease [Methylococcaceae bacterium HT4]TXL18178.1 VapC toxin family PIN domain ribonuclease [Methylococcaceae bacterium HT3]TXL21099.1 VapC toxin family PIN domain ribonuclease [Methylococcaceae bacterium HT5]TXL23435.1 VapC toxin family PIN domain ribonucleas
MKYLLDTCVISEVIKPRADKNVISWVKNQNEESLYLSVLTFGEIEKGIEKSPDEARKRKLQLWVEEDLKKRFEGRIIPINIDISVKWGAIQGNAELQGKPMPAIDGLIAVSGLVHNCIVVTRNVSDMEQSTVELLNPWIKNR